ncbi:hypothetical protein PROFUN_08295 [Planoprotostelium fungivorum]|uniref:Protein kinase domain-containing protein n=1 Tax=Planoprotostelium fungivorum TaxID=1890364 RepID=A0A2P6NJY7_9EUKA|nr:hypothetical protein PROFUN_08295 [Planoprotostelium fungivorum]
MDSPGATFYVGVDVQGGQNVNISGISFTGIRQALTVTSTPHVLLSNLTFQSNTAGAQISNCIGSAIVQDCLFAMNGNPTVVGNNGGGLRLMNSAGCDAIINRTTFRRNTVGVLNAFRGGGGVSFEGNFNQIIVDQSRFSGNLANGGAGVHFDKDATSKGVSVTNCRFYNNTAYDIAGGPSILVNGDTPLVSVYNTTFTKNTCGYGSLGGGGLQVAGNVDKVVVDSSDFYDNFGSQGGACNFLSTVLYEVIFRNCNFVRNGAFSGGVFWVYTNQATNNVTVDNCSFVNNTAILHSSCIQMTSRFSPLIAIRNSYFSGHTVTSFNLPGYATITIDSEGDLVVMDNVTMENNPTGGMVHNGQDDDLNIQISNSNFRNNSGVFSGVALFINKVGGLSIYNSTFSNHTSDTFGGAIVVSYGQTLNISGSTFTKNQATNGYDGGAIWLSAVSNIVMAGNTFSENSAAQGAAVGILTKATVHMVLQNNIFTANVARYLGACLFFSSLEDTNSTLIMINNTHLRNKASYGAVLQLTGDLSSIYISGMSAIGNTATSGAVLYLSNSDGLASLTIDSSLIYDNVAVESGALYTSIDIKQLIVTNTVFSHNSATLAQAGAFTLQGIHNTTIYNTTFSYNSGVSGGALYIGSADIFSLNNVQMNNNTARTGGAIYIDDLAVLRGFSVSQSTMEGNVASQDGGAIAIRGTGYYNVASSNITQNSAGGDGGGIAGTFRNTSLFIGNSRLSLNTADSQGGAISVLQSATVTTSSMTLNDDVIEGNTASSGGGVSVVNKVHTKMNGGSLHGNKAGKGAGMALQGGSILLNNVDNRDNLLVSNDALLSVNGTTSSSQVTCDSGQPSTSSDNRIICKPASGKNVGLIVGLCVGLGFLFILLLLVAFFLIRNKMNTSKEEKDQFEMMTTILGKDRNGLLDYAEFKNGNTASNGGGVSVVNKVNTKMNGGSLHGNKAGKGAGMTLQGGSLLLNNVDDRDNLLVSNDALLSVNGTTSSSQVTCDSGQPSTSSDNRITCKPASSKNVGLIVGLCVGLGFLFILLLLVAFFLIRNKMNTSKEEKDQFEMMTTILGKDRNGLLDYAEFKNVVEMSADKLETTSKADWRGDFVLIRKINKEMNTDRMTTFMEEVALLRGMKRHPNLILFYGVTLPPQPFTFVTEFADGGNLRDFIKGGTPIDERLQTKWALQIALAMHHLHSEGIVHKELCSKNILIANMQMKVAGFGTSQMQNRSKIDKIEESAKYLGPEYLSKGLFIKETDVYAYSILLWEIVYQAEPYGVIKPLQIAVSVSQSLRPRVEQNDMGKLMEQCWHQEPVERPDFQHICCELEDMKGDPIEAAPMVRTEDERVVTQYTTTRLPNELRDEDDGVEELSLSITYAFDERMEYHFYKLTAVEIDITGPSSSVGRAHGS